MVVFVVVALVTVFLGAAAFTGAFLATGLAAGLVVLATGLATGFLAVATLVGAFFPGAFATDLLTGFAAGLLALTATFLAGALLATGLAVFFAAVLGLVAIA
ncbi:MAG: hypothetical protein ACKOAC_04345, partial [Fluviibacter sp.]